MSEYKKLDEIFPDGYGDGRKFCSSDNTDYWFVPYFNDPMGRWHARDFSNDHFVVYEHVDVREWFPPKKTKKVKMYKPVFKTYNGNYSTHINREWHSDKSVFNIGEKAGWMEMEIEVEE